MSPTDTTDELPGLKPGPAEGHPIAADEPIHGAATVLCLAVAAVLVWWMALSRLVPGDGAAEVAASAPAQRTKVQRLPLECPRDPPPVTT